MEREGQGPSSQPIPCKQAGSMWGLASLSLKILVAHRLSWDPHWNLHRRHLPTSRAARVS